jgi:hypothetical protein
LNSKLIICLLLIPSIILPRQLAGATSESDPVRTSLHVSDGSYFVEGSFSVESPSEVVFGVLSDYENIEHFVLTIKSSQMIKGEKGEAYVEQRGTLYFLLLPIRFYLLLSIKEIKNQSITFSDVSHRDFNTYEGSWQLTIEGNRTIVGYSLKAKPRFSFWQNWIEDRFKTSARNLLSGVRQEILKQTISPQKND